VGPRAACPTKVTGEGKEESQLLGGKRGGRWWGVFISRVEIAGRKTGGVGGGGVGLSGRGERQLIRLKRGPLNGGGGARTTRSRRGFPSRGQGWGGEGRNFSRKCSY